MFTHARRYTIQNVNLQSLAGIYIHIPFCRQACTYCNFHFSTSLKLKDEFLAALHTEITTPDDFIDTSETIETIYFGGGTPSLLLIEELKDILQAVRKKFNVVPDAEITLEANPDDISTLKVQQWMKLGINRLSLGIQSFDDAELKWMNRAHTAEDSRRSIHEIKEAGIHNFSVDVIFGSPLLKDEALKKTMQLIIDEQITHISCYALTAEPKTALHKMIAVNKTTAPDPEIQARQFLLIADMLQASSYEHYEISNYAKPGMRSKHNSSYWQGKAYYGFGAGAHAFNGKNKRRWNIANNALYIQQLKKGILPFEEETLSEIQQLNEYIMTALRTAEGINLAVVAENFGTEKEQALKNKFSSDLLLKEKILLQNNHLLLSAEGKLFADGIAAELFF